MVSSREQPRSIPVVAECLTDDPGTATHLLVPFAQWIRGQLLISMSFISVFQVVPQGLSYATSAGVTSVFGLYGAFLPCLVYSLLGTSRQLAVGPVAVTSLVIYSSLQGAMPCASAISNPNTITDPTQLACQAAYNQAAIQ